MGDTGVTFGELGYIEGVHATQNGQSGIDGIGLVPKCSARENGDFGIVALTVLDSQALKNGGIGIGARTVANSWGMSNFSTGIFADTVTGSTGNENGERGIVATVATGCSGYGNSTTPHVDAYGAVGQNVCDITPCP